MRRHVLLASVVGLLAAAGYVVSPWSPVRYPDAATPVGLATGGPGGLYHAYGQALAAHAPVDVVATGGSLDNVEQLRRGQVQFALATADVVLPDRDSIRAVARLYDNFVHLVVRADAAIHRPQDLRGRAVSVGEPSSGTALVADRILTAARLRPGVDVTVVALDQATAVAALSADCAVSCVDAVFVSEGVASPTVLAFALSGVDVRLVDLGRVADEVRRDPASGAVYRVGELPAGAYPWLKVPLRTITVPTLLLTTAAVPHDVVRRMTALVFDSAPGIATADTPVGQVAAQIDRHAAIFTGAVTLHPGALAYYRDTKVAS